MKNAAKKISYPLLFINLISIQNLSAETIEDFYRSFKLSKYIEAKESLEKINFEEKNLASKFYLLGMTNSRLQEFDQAIKNFEKAIELKTSANDIYYELGQAYYATNDLNKSRLAFLKSIKNNFNAALSYYYIGNVSQTLEEYNRAKDAYLAILRLKNTDSKIIQVAKFQLAETLLSIARESNKNLTQIVDKYVIPMLKQAKEADQGSGISNEIEIRIQELLSEFKLDPNLLINGRRIPSKKYALNLSQTIEFDNNVTLANDQSSVAQSKKESFVFGTEGYGKYDFIFKKRYIISPDLRINYTQYSDTKDSSVYQNNSYTITSAVRSKFEHQINNKPASFIFDLETNYIARDKYQIKERNKYAESTTLIFGEKFNFLKIGETSLKFKYKNYDSYSSSLDNKTLTISADQIYLTNNQNLFLFLLQFDKIDNYNSTSNSTNSYLFRIDYLMPEILPQYTLGLNLSTTLLDTLEQKNSRGIEKTFSPGIEITRDLSDKLSVDFSYEFTKNTSKSDSYDYTKQIMASKIKYSF